jgi:hypothetical protein
MVKKRAARSATRNAPKSKPTKRLKQIQKVFDQLGIGNEESRRSVRPLYAPSSEQPVHYRIILSGSTLG